MSTTVYMPKLGESVVEGKIGRWLKKPGDAVREFEPLLEVETDKVTTEVTATAAGTVLETLRAEGETVPVGVAIAVIGEAGAAPMSAPPAAPPAAAPPEARPRTPLASRANGQTWVSPVVGRIAAENGVDVDAVPGTGEGGRVTKKDILAYLDARGAAAPAPWELPGSGELFKPSDAPAPDPAPAGPESGDRLIPHSPMRRAIAEHMVRSVRTSPHVTTIFEVDLSRVVAHRAAHRSAFDRDGVNLTFTPYLIAAIVAGLKRHPRVNSTWEDNGIRVLGQVHIGVAVALGDDGLIVPVIRNADTLNLLGLARAVNDLANRARRKQLKPDETLGGTFTLTNHGASGSLLAAPIINQPQCGILAAGKIEKRAIVVSAGGVDSIAIKTMAYLGLTFDHRILDGASADAFMTTVKAALEEWPER